MGHFLNFGAGPNQLAPPWQNLNAEHDIRKRLKFESGSASFMLAEHVIEHAPFLQGFGFLQECYRVLEPGGVLRLAFPDVRRFLVQSREGAFYGASDATQAWAFNGRALRYAQELERRDSGQIIREAPAAKDKVRAAALMLLVGWQHQAAWSEVTAAGALLAVGFSVVPAPYGSSGHPELAGVDGHHHDVGSQIAEMETTVLEATK